ncbi:MAG: GAF domain-containing sensor histidine kinase [Gemmatimonadales bacterium]|nr:GAF domain-containing sensor histidine kinase [Gemmatimonadales bacterium]
MPPSPELATLTALARALSRPADLADSLQAALGTVSEALGLETGWVWLLDEETAAPRLAATRALPAALREHPEAMHGDCYCLSTFRGGDLRGAANVNVVWCSRLSKLVDDSTHLRCHASVPLAAGERRLGMLNVASADWRVLSEDELSLLTTAGALVSLAVERSRLESARAWGLAAEERNRLAREIHDTIAQSLAALTMQLEAADARAEAQGDRRLGEAVSRALALARSTLDEARRSVLDLRAAPLEGRSLPRAIEQLAAEMRETSVPPLLIQVSTNGFDADGGDLPAAVEVGLYRIAQQALANAARHAEARRVSVLIAREPGQVRLCLEDDGIGFDPAAVPPGRFGLIGMRERARLLGGTLAVGSRAGGGAAIQVVVPLGSAS